jgi:hypothetical protein
MLGAVLSTYGSYFQEMYSAYIRWYSNKVCAINCHTPRRHAVYRIVQT